MKQVLLFVKEMSKIYKCIQGRQSDNTMSPYKRKYKIYSSIIDSIDITVF